MYSLTIDMNFLVNKYWACNGLIVFGPVLIVELGHTILGLNITKQVELIIGYRNTFNLTVRIIIISGIIAIYSL